MKKTYILLIIAMISVCLISFSTSTVDWAQEESTDQPQLYFWEGNTCLPPCWFGIAPDLSTSEDVARFLEQYEGDCDLRITGESEKETDLVLNGAYEFRLCPWDSSIRETFGSLIIIKDQIVSAVIIRVNQDIPVNTFLVEMGQPDIVRFANGYISDSLILIYIEERTRIVFDSLPDISCDFNAFRTWEIINYSSEMASELITPVASLEAQPRLVSYQLPEERDLAIGVFQNWYANPDIRCLAILQELEISTDIPNFLTLTPLPVEETQYPIATPSEETNLFTPTPTR